MANPRTSIARTADSKAVTSASSLALASNPDRLEVTIVNDADTADVYLGFVTPSNPTGAAIAGKGIARPDSLIAAIRLASEMAARRGAS